MPPVSSVGRVFPLTKLAISLSATPNTTAGCLQQSRKILGFLSSNILSTLMALSRLALLLLEESPILMVLRGTVLSVVARGPSVPIHRPWWILGYAQHRFTLLLRCSSQSLTGIQRLMSTTNGITGMLSIVPQLSSPASQKHIGLKRTSPTMAWLTVTRLAKTRAPVYGLCGLAMEI